MGNLQFTFVVPPFLDFASGGNVFNERLTNAIQKAGIKIETSDFEQLTNTVPFADRIVILDSLFLDMLNASPVALSGFSKKYLLVHFLPSMFPPDEEKFERQERPLLEQFDGLIVTSEFSKNYFLEKGLEKPILVVSPACEMAGAPEMTFLKEMSFLHCLLVANLVGTKGILEFFQILANAKWRGSNRLKITIAGSDNIEPDYASQCKQLWNNDLWLKKITHYIGPMPQSELTQLYQLAHIFISTSFFETFGMALQEARFFGLPILAIKGGNVEFHVEENQNGRLFSRMENLVEFMGEVIENEQLLKKYQITAKQMKGVGNYTWDDAAAFFLGHFSKS